MLSWRFCSFHYRRWSYFQREHTVFTYHKFLQNLSTVLQHLHYEHSYDFPMVNAGILICCFLCYCSGRRPAKSCRYHHLQCCLRKILFCLPMYVNKIEWADLVRLLYVAVFFNAATVDIDVNVNLRYFCYSIHNFNVFIFIIWRQKNRQVNKMNRKVPYQFA